MCEPVTDLNATSEHERREGFIDSTLNEMIGSGILAADVFEQAGEWLRTLWLEARDEPWGDNHEVSIDRETGMVRIVDRRTGEVFSEFKIGPA